MSDDLREMSLDECFATLPKTHRAVRELIQLKQQVERLKGLLKKTFEILTDGFHDGITYAITDEITCELEEK